MSEFDLNVFRLPAQIEPSDVRQCRICTMIGRRAKLTRCVSLVKTQGRSGLRVHKTYSCADHLTDAINDAMSGLDMALRVYTPPADRVHSETVHRTARALLEMACIVRRHELETTANQFRALATRVHEAALFLSHYENKYGESNE